MRLVELLGNWLGKIFIAASILAYISAFILVFIVLVFIATVAVSDPAPSFLYTPLQAQPVEDPRWTQFTRQQDTLISNNVRSILAVEDALWFGTDAGISRYTGEWRSFHAAHTEAGDEALYPGVRGRKLGDFAPPGQTTALAVDEQGRVWAGTDLGAVAVREHDAWYLVVMTPSARGAPINALAVDEAGTWIGTAGGLYLWADNRLQRVDSIGHRSVEALAANGDTLWVGVDNGLWRIRNGRWAQVGTGEPWFDRGVYALWVDGERTLWVGTPLGVAWRSYSSSRWRRAASQDEHGESATVQALTTDHSGALWAGTDGAGVFSYDANKGRSHSYGAGRDTSLGSRFVRGVTVDQDGSIWLATPAGVYRYQAQMWYSNRGAGEVNDERYDFINDMLVDSQERLWIATGGAGIRRKAEIGAQETRFGGDDGVPSWVFALAEDGHGNIWAGTHAGLLRFSNGQWFRPVASEDLPAQEVISLLVTDDTLWIGTTAGMSRYHLVSARLTEIPELMGKSIEALAADSTGSVWVGAEPGLYVFEPSGRLTALHLAARGEAGSLPGGPVTTNGLAADWRTPGGMWVNLLDAGLVYWDGDRWQRDMSGEHVPGSLVWRLYSDLRGGSLWIGGEAGVSRFDGTSWAFLTAQDGLQTASIHALVSSEGGYWIGGRNGLTHFRPDTSSPWLRVAALGGASPQDDDTLRLHAGEPAHLRIDAGDLQTLSHRMKISYRKGVVEAWGTAWQDWAPTAAGVTSFTFDDVGEYRLEFQARDLSFNYSEPVSLQLSVVQPAALVTVPLLGSISQNVFRALSVLALLVVSGSAYIGIVLARHRKRSIEAVERKFNPYISGEPVRREDMFFGRRALLQRIMDTLHHNSIMIHGERRIGKTTLLYQLTSVLRDVDDPDYWFTPVYIDLEGTEQEDFFHYLMEEIYHTVEAYLEMDIAAAAGKVSPAYQLLGNADYTDRDFNRDLRDVVEAIQIYGRAYEPEKQARLILLLDEMDVVSGFDQLVQQQLRRIFMREVAATVGAVVAGIRISKAWERVESPWFNMFNEIALEPFTREQGRELLIEPVKGYYTYQKEAVEFILDMAGGRPFRIQQYGLEAVNQMLSANRRTILMRDAHVAHERLSALEAAQIQNHGVGA